MKPFLTVVLSGVFFGIQTFATDLGYWKVVATEELAAESPQQVQELLVQYPNELASFHIAATASLLSGRPVHQITKLKLLKRRLQWQGPSMCGEDDPRLKREDVVLDSFCLLGDAACVKIGRKAHLGDPCGLGN